jgi:hypothetical protein
MKKFVYLCGMMLLSMNIMAQIDLNDKNWDTVFIEDFSGNRYWDRHWDDSTGVSGYKPLWRCFHYCLWNSGVIHPKEYYGDFSAYQPCNAVFDSDNTLKLVGSYKSEKCMTCSSEISDTTFLPAPWHKYCHFCDATPQQKYNIHYFSGMIESTDSLGYGYYEIKCKMPIHRGSSDAFWLWSDYGKYEEIDMFEHSFFFCNGNTEKSFISGIFYNPDGTNYHDTIINGVLHHGAFKYARCSYYVPTTSTSLDQYHTYGCLWLPERVAWYFDGVLYNEETDPSHIPQHPMWLKITHYQDSAAILSNNPETWWHETDEMTIDYVKYYRLKTDCDTDLVIRSTFAFQNFNNNPLNYTVKRSITMGGQNTTMVIPNNINFTMRAVDSITIDGAFEVPCGTEMTFITQECPECSQEGLYFNGFCPL